MDFENGYFHFSLFSEKFYVQTYNLLANGLVTYTEQSSELCDNMIKKALRETD